MADLGTRIWWEVRQYARDDDHADDLLQDCWQTILERLHRYSGRGSFAGWAIAVSRNVCRMRLRQAKRASARETILEGPGTVLDSAPNPDEELELRERREVLYRAIGQLPDREREAVVLRMLEERSTAETARAMGVSRSVARSLVQRAVYRMRRMERIRQLFMDWNT